MSFRATTWELFPRGTWATNSRARASPRKKSRFVNAPLISELPLALECELEKVLDGRIVGRIKNVSADERILGSDGEISLEQFSPITYDTVHHGYYALGARVGSAFKDGEALK